MKLYCLDSLTGTFIWSYTTDDHMVSAPATINNNVYIDSADGKVYCFGNYLPVMRFDKSTVV